ncbi:MAG: hypothetical protein KAI81_00045, partial [Candidatus Marinimicrobia bacterium]|nr:hypothetical protein [Candidatus Neomarinimicrobiota bacterium]
MFITISTVPLVADIRHEGTVAILSWKVGSDIDSLENIYYQVFPKIQGLQRAIFYRISDKKLVCQLKYRKANGKLSNKRITLTDKTFQEKKTTIDLIPAMSDSWRDEHNGKKLREARLKIIQAIPLGSWIEIQDNNKNKTRGFLKTFTKDNLIIKEQIFKKTIPY